MKDLDHPLKMELYHKIQSGPQTLSWLEQCSLDGVWYWDLNNMQQAWFSPKFKQMLGFSPHEDIEHFISHDNRLLEEITNLLDSSQFTQDRAEQDYDHLFPLKHKDSSKVWSRSKGMIILNDQSVPIRMLGTHMNMTQYKNAEQTLADKQHEIEEFIYTASHDLNAPARAILNLLGWIEEDCYGVLPEESQGHFNLLKKRSKHLHQMLQDLLLYSRIGGTCYEKETISLSKIASDVFHGLAGSASFSIKVVDAHIHLQKAPFEDVLNALFSNAIKHHNRATGLIDVSIEILDKEYIFYIRDDGPGIPKEYQSSVFKIFQTLQSRDKVGGSGIGLASVKKIVECYGGGIQVDSDGHHGTCFIIRWPC